MRIRRQRPRPCQDHVWVVTLNAGLERHVCAECGELTIEPVASGLSISEEMAALGVAPESPATG